MRKLLGVVLLVALLMMIGWPISARGADPGPTHRYVYFPSLAVLIDLDNWPSAPFATASLNTLPFTVVSTLTLLDTGFTYLEGPALPTDWLDNPTVFAAALQSMTRIDIAIHTQGANTVWSNDVFTLPNWSSVASIASPPQLSDPEDLRALRIGGGFWWARIYAGIDTGNIVNDIITVNTWNTYHGSPMPRHFEIVEWRDYQPYKVLTFYSGGPDDPKALARELILDIVQNAGSDHVFAIDFRSELVHSPTVQLFPSGKPPFNEWVSLTGRFHKADLTVADEQKSLKAAPSLSSWPIRDPATAICPNERYIWYLPPIWGLIHDQIAQDQGERCYDVDTLVEYDLYQWWNPLGAQFKEILNPTPFDDAGARAWVFLHVAMNNGHRLIDAVNPKKSTGGQVQSIVDVNVTDPTAYPWTFEGGPKIHGYNRLQVSPTVSEFHKRMGYILGATGGELTARQAFFRTHLADIFSNVHIYVMDPVNPTAKVEITVPELFQMIGDRWSASRAFTLLPLRFFWTDMPIKDYGQGGPVTFEIICTFDTNPTLGGPWVPMRIIAQAHEAAYLTTEYGDVWFLLQNLLQGRPMPEGLPNPFDFLTGVL